MQAAPADAANARPVRAGRPAKTVPGLTSGGALDAVTAVGHHDRIGFRWDAGERDVRRGARLRSAAVSQAMRRYGQCIWPVLPRTSAGRGSLKIPR